MKVDYIIVGCGLAGIAFCEQLRQHGKSFVVFDNASQQSSTVAAGLYNPVILKRFSKVWKSKEQLGLLEAYYGNLEKLLEVKLDYKFPILRKFTSIEEQNLWFQAADKPNLEPFLSTQLVKNSSPFINAEFGFGEVLKAGRIDTPLLISSYRIFLKNNKQLFENPFDYNAVAFQSNRISYQHIEAKQLICAEGFGLKGNPFFNMLPLNGTKGEVLTIKAFDLKLDYAIKSSVFVIPVDKDLYKVGATYNWEDKTNAPTLEGKAELVSKLKTLIICDFEVVEHVAGIRPTVKDRRPLVGRHPEYPNMYVLNGLGTRGVMISPYVAEALFNHIEEGGDLNPEINIRRFVTPD